MANLKEIRSRISTVKNTQQVTKAMKMVAAAKLRKSQERMFQLRPYAAKMNEIIANVVAAVNVEDIPSKLVEQRPVNHVLVIVIASNRGLCGGFNSNIFRHGMNFIDENLSQYKAEGKLSMLCVGKKSYEYFSRRGLAVLDNKFFDPFSNLSFEQANLITNKVFDGFMAGEWDKVYIVYNEFRNVMAQNRIAEEFLPLVVKKDEHAKINADYIFEPDRAKLLADLIPTSLRLRLYRAVVESNAAEQGARMVAMDQATENANALLKELKIKYNKARQAAITKEILEIAGGADALANA